MTWAAVAAVIAAASVAVTYDQGQRQLGATKKAAYENAVIQNKQLEEQRNQISKQAANDQTERKRSQMIEESRLRVISGESGALGVSADRLIGDSKFQLGSDIATIDANKTSALKQTDYTGLANYNQNVSAINQATNRAPTLLGTGLQIGAIGVDGYVKRKKAQE